MAGAKKTFKKMKGEGSIKERFGTLNPEDSAANPLKPIEAGVEDVGDMFTPDVPEEEEETIIPIPDERSANIKARKRRARAKSSGRSGTILTEGLGG